jgi:hypothetical protein
MEQDIRGLNSRLRKSTRKPFFYEVHIIKALWGGVVSIRMFHLRKYSTDFDTQFLTGGLH